MTEEELEEFTATSDRSRRLVLASRALRNLARRILANENISPSLPRVYHDPTRTRLDDIPATTRGHNLLLSVGYYPFVQPTHPQVVAATRERMAVELLTGSGMLGRLAIEEKYQVSIGMVCRAAGRVYLNIIAER